MKNLDFVVELMWSKLMKSRPYLFGFVLFLALLNSGPLFGQTDLTGVYLGNDGGTYYVRQSGNTIYWYGEHPSQSFANVFKGTLRVQSGGKGNTGSISGTFYDLPNGRASGSGQLSLRFANNQITKVSGAFGATEFTKTTRGTNADIRLNTFYSNSDYDNIWESNDGGIYAMRRVGNTLVWFGQRKESNGQIRWANVGFGTINGNNITLEWADVPKDHNQSFRGSGTMLLNMSNKQISRTRIISGGGFGGSTWNIRQSVALPNLISSGLITFEPNYMIRDRNKGLVYIKNVKPMAQITLGEAGIYRYSNTQKAEHLEGCGPIAGAMLLGFWHSERGYNIMHASDLYDGTRHPTHTIKEFRDHAGTHVFGSRLSDGVNQAATRKLRMEKTLEYYASQINLRNPDKPKLTATIRWPVRMWRVKEPELRENLEKGNPVILLLSTTPPCLSPDNQRKDMTPVFGDHYVVVVGYNDQEKVFYVMPGWEEKAKSTSSGPDVHQRRDNEGNGRAHCKCTYDEIRDSNVGLIYLREQ